jgi:hypothetical protein
MPTWLCYCAVPINPRPLTMLRTASPPAAKCRAGAVEAPTIRRSEHASGHDNRSRYRQVCFSNPRSDAAGNVIVRRQLKPVGFAILSEAAAVPHRHQSLRFVASLVARTQSAGAYRAPDAGSPTSSGRRMMLQTRRPFAKRSREQTCGSWRLRRSTSRAT